MRKIRWYEMPIDSPQGRMLTMVATIMTLTILLLTWLVA